MRIGFNLLPYVPGAHGGAEVYMRNIIADLQRMQALWQDMVLIGERATVAQYQPTDRSIPVLALPIPWRGSRLARAFWEQLALPEVCAVHRIDCLVSNYVTPLFAPCRTVTVIHDLLYQRYPGVFERSKLIYWRAAIPASIRRSNAVVTVSRFSAQEISELFPKAQNKLFTTVEGIRPSLIRSVPTSLPVASVSGSYLLCVATFGKHKNLHRLVQAFAALPAGYEDLRLVLVGAARTPDAREYKASIEFLVEQHGLADRVLFTDHVSDPELATLYRNAQGLVLPSLYEGFGLPIIEAQHFGCPVACSNAGSLPEIAGEAAITFDPISPLSIRDALLTLLSQPETRERLQQLGYENVVRFSWPKAAEQLLTAIEFAVNDGRPR